MTALDIQQSPAHLSLAQLDRQQVCYVLLTVSAQAAGSRSVNWAVVADASRSMRIPVVDEAQFRALVQQGGAQETLVDGVPVWQLRTPVPPEMRAAAPSPLDHVARALHSIVERLDGEDRLTLAACAEEAALLARNLAGMERTALVHAIERLRTLNLGDETDLAQGLKLALDEQRRGRDKLRVDRLLLLTDGFTQKPEACVELARQAANEGVTITTVGLGSEFQDDLLRQIADQSGGRALFVPHLAAIPQVIAHELTLARVVATRALSVTMTTQQNVSTRRITRIRPTLTLLDEPGETRSPSTRVHVGDVMVGTPTVLLLELLVPPSTTGLLGQVTFTSENQVIAEHTLRAAVQPQPVVQTPDVVQAAARANVARIQRRAESALARGILPEATQLFRALATRLDELNESTLAATARQQAAALELTGQTAPQANKELTYATRRLG